MSSTRAFAFLMQANAIVNAELMSEDFPKVLDKVRAGVLVFPF